MIINKTKNIIISKKEKLCKNIFSQTKGLMFSKKQTLIFSWKKEKKQPIHMFFVFFPIDLLYLNKNKEIIEIKTSLKPFSTYHPLHPAKYLIESPAKTITKIKLKDKLEFKK